jgi:hypothetical protein
VLEAINQVGGLNEFVTDVYIFRQEPPPSPSPEEVDSVKGIESDSQEPEQGRPPAAGDVPPPDLDELVSAVVEDARGEPARESPKREEDEVPEIAPEPTDPFLWVDDEWVPNPAYRKGAPDLAQPPSPPAFETGTPAVNWSRIAGETRYRIIRIPAESLRTGDPHVNIIVRAGDVIRIVSGEIGVYYVMGQVNRVGPFAFNAEPITVKAAIAAAGGLSGLAWPDRCTVYRRMGGREQMIQVNLDRIFAGKEPDFMIRRGDIINVGTHPFAPFLQRIRAWTLPTPVNNAGYSFTYSRNFADIDSFAVQQNPRNRPSRFEGLLP